MEIHNGNYEEILIRQHKVLKSEDRIVFRVGTQNIIYYVTTNHCYCMEGKNDTIFRELGLDPVTACRQGYGYRPIRTTCQWPTSNDQDYEALTRVVIGLFQLIAPHDQSHETIGISIPKNQTIKIIL